MVKMNASLEDEVKSLTQQLADVCAMQENSVIDRKATKDAVAAKKVAKREFLMRTKELKKLRRTHHQILLARNAELDNLKVQLGGAQMRAADAKYERDGAKARLQQLQSSQQGFQTEDFCVQNEIAALGAWLAERHNFLLCQLKHSSGQMFSGLARNILK